MNVHTNQVYQPGDPVHFVGGEPDKNGDRIPTHVHGDVDVDASGGYEDLREATHIMRNRNEQALWSMGTGEETTNPDYDAALAQQNRVPASDESSLSPLDVLRHKARLMGVGGPRNQAMTLGSWRRPS